MSEKVNDVNKKGASLALWSGMVRTKVNVW